MGEKELKTIVAIAERAEEKDLMMFNKMSLIMDLECATQEFDLRLNDLLNADDFNFTHDVVGIQRNLNRQTKRMENMFVPRYAGF